MRTVSSCVSDKEYAAIVEFANQYGETMSSAIKKTIFDVTALAREDCPSGFELNMESREGKDEDDHDLDGILFSDNVDKVRQILGWKEIDLWGYKKEKEGKSSDAKQSNEQEQGKKELIDRADKIIEQKFQDESLSA